MRMKEKIEPEVSDSIAWKISGDGKKYPSDETVLHGLLQDYLRKVDSAVGAHAAQRGIEEYTIRRCCGAASPHQ